MRKINKIVSSVIMTLTVGLSLVSCKDNDNEMEYSKTTTITQNNTQTPNPFIECNSLLEASNITGFDLEVPKILSNILKQSSVRVMNKEMIEVIYTGDSEKISIRKAIGHREISGNYNAFSDVYEFPVDDLNVTFKGNNGKINVATWIDDEYSFSIDSTAGLTREQMVFLIAEIE